jgi:hypothetical protein
LQWFSGVETPLEARQDHRPAAGNGCDELRVGFVNLVERSFSVRSTSPSPWSVGLNAGLQSHDPQEILAGGSDTQNARSPGRRIFAVSSWWGPVLTIRALFAHFRLSSIVETLVGTADAVPLVWILASLGRVLDQHGCDLPAVVASGGP